jgi:hypothetical protein
MVRRSVGGLEVLALLFLAGCSRPEVSAAKVLTLEEAHGQALVMVLDHKLEPADIVDRYQGVSPATYSCKHLKAPWDSLSRKEQQDLLAWSLGGILVHADWEKVDRGQRNIWSKEGQDEGVERMLAAGFDAKARIKLEAERLKAKAAFEAQRSRHASQPLD